MMDNTNSAQRPPLSPDDFELLSAYIDDALDADERQQLEQRLQEDPALYATLQSLQAMLGAMRGLPDMRAPRDFSLTPEQVRDNPPVMIASSPVNVIVMPRRPPNIISFAAAAVFVVLIGGALLINQSGLSSPASESQQVANAPTAMPTMLPATSILPATVTLEDTAQTNAVQPVVPLAEPVIASTFAELMAVEATAVGAVIGGATGGAENGTNLENLQDGAPEAASGMMPATDNAEDTASDPTTADDMPADPASDVILEAVEEEVAPIASAAYGVDEVAEGTMADLADEAVDLDATTMTDEVMTDEVMTDEVMTDEVMTDEVMTDEVMTDEVMADEVMADETDMSARSVAPPMISLETIGRTLWMLLLVFLQVIAP